MVTHDQEPNSSGSPQDWSSRTSNALQSSCSGYSTPEGVYDSRLSPSSAGKAALDEPPGNTQSTAPLEPDVLYMPVPQSYQRLSHFPSEPFAHLSPHNHPQPGYLPSSFPETFEEHQQPNFSHPDSATISSASYSHFNGYASRHTYPQQDYSFFPVPPHFSLSHQTSSTDHPIPLAEDSCPPPSVSPLIEEDSQAFFHGPQTTMPSPSFLHHPPPLSTSYLEPYRLGGPPCTFDRTLTKSVETSAYSSSPPLSAVPPVHGGLPFHISSLPNPPSSHFDNCLASLSPSRPVSSLLLPSIRSSVTNWKPKARSPGPFEGSPSVYDTFSNQSDSTSPSRASSETLARPLETSTLIENLSPTTGYTSFGSSENHYPSPARRHSSLLQPLNQAPSKSCSRSTETSLGDQASDSKFSPTPSNGASQRDAMISNAVQHLTTQVPRRRLTVEQEQILLKRFAIQEYLSKREMEELAERLKIPTSQLRTWFGNRRSKLKAAARQRAKLAAGMGHLSDAELKSLNRRINRGNGGNPKGETTSPD